MRFILSALLVCSALSTFARGDDGTIVLAEERRRNNLVSDLLEVDGISEASPTFTFSRPRAGWIFVSAMHAGTGSLRITLDPASGGDVLIERDGENNATAEAMRNVAAGEHTVRVECGGGGLRVEKLIVRAIPDLIHCGLGFDASIKSYPRYDLKFLEKDVLPNITATIVPSNLQLPQEEIDNWHRRGKRFIAEVGIHGEAKTADD